MTHPLFRSWILAAALTSVAGIALADEPAAAAPDPTPPAAAPPAASGPSPEMVKKARAAGLKPEMRNGATVFCWEDADIGSRFKTKKCVDEGRLQDVIDARQAQKDALGRAGGNYGGGK